jgi:membrane protease YdiL (CAAX protease family)
MAIPTPPVIDVGSLRPLRGYRAKAGAFRSDLCRQRTQDGGTSTCLSGAYCGQSIGTIRRARGLAANARRRAQIRRRSALRPNSWENTVEALAFLGLALTAGFVEEFVFRGYIQRQCQVLCGNTIVASLLQLIIFTQGHLYQGWIRLVPVFLIGVVVTIVALWRKSLIPGMIAHGFGDGLVAFLFFAKHL